ncbi:MAG: CBS domain-containing protein [Chloroflexi bacterium]|nr:CBS domain-containing protein [Chloroflexota bacterium]
MAEFVKDLMRHGAVTCGLDTTVKEIAQIMVFNRIRYVVVTDDHGAVAGIISARSILKAWGKDLEKTTAKDILLPYTITTTPDTPLAEAIKLMQQRRIQHLVIVSDSPRPKRVVGILSASDIVRYMART